jgi:hypothetical protein
LLKDLVKIAQGGLVYSWFLIFALLIWMLAGHKVSQAMSSGCAAIPSDLTLQQLVDEHILSGGQRCFLVNRGSDTIGLMTLHRIKEVPRGE